MDVDVHSGGRTEDLSRLKRCLTYAFHRQNGHILPGESVDEAQDIYGTRWRHGAIATFSFDSFGRSRSKRHGHGCHRPRLGPADGGNPEGDVTIAAFSDHNCPFCKATERNLDRLIKDNGNIRLVYKDWPFLNSASVYGARLALAAKYQGQYVSVHRAMMSISGGDSTKDQMLATVRSSEVDFERLQDDLHKHIGEIDAVLARNAQQARLPF